MELVIIKNKLIINMMRLSSDSEESRPERVQTRSVFDVPDLINIIADFCDEESL